jgi:uncharacterized protein (DUF885 family)
MPVVGSAPAFSAWLDDFFASYYRHRPVNATFIGMHEHDDRLPDYSDSGVGDALGDAEGLLSRLAALAPEPLDAAQRLDRRLAEGFLRIQRWEYDSPHFRWQNPSLYTGEAIFGVLGLLLSPRAGGGERVDHAISRLRATPRLLAQARDTVRQAPRAWTERARRECAAALVLLGEGMRQSLRGRTSRHADLDGAADLAMSAFAAFDGYLASELLPNPIESYACGAEAYALLLRAGHALAEDASEIEARAIEQMADAEASLAAGAGAFGLSEWRDAIARLADAHPTIEQFYGRFEAVWSEARAVAEAHDLLTVPDWPVRFVQQPDWVRPAAPSLYFIPYRSPAPLDPPPYGTSFIPTIDSADPAEQERRLRATNDHVIKQNYVVHHAGIGHHTQNWYAMRAASRIGRIAAVDCASRIAMLCGGTMAEGWASYTTDLMNEVGFLTPLESFAQHYARLRMAARTVVDVRLHDGRFSLEHGAAFYRDRVGMAPAAAQAEAVKNTLFPATACMYLAGWDGIRRLRREIAAREGGAFSLRRFHDRLLSYGSVPVSLVAAEMLEAPSSSAPAAVEPTSTR